MGQMAVWIDGNEARIFHVDANRFDEATVRSPQHHLHRHPKDQETKVHNHPDDEYRFFREVSQSLAGADAILVVGPSMTKLHFFRYVQKHNPALESRIVGLETVDHPTDRQIVAHVRSYFLASPPRHGE
jgi:stalled ribosome rescue protein Dom34